MAIHLTASMMCANFLNLGKELSELENAGVDSLHIDLMDGHFVDNFGMGFQDMECIKKASTLPLEVHLMMEEAHNYFQILFPLGFSTIYIHPEAERNPAGALEQLVKAGVTPGIAINPGTSIDYITELLYAAKKVLVMCVNPGHYGRANLPYVDQKIMKLVDLQKSLGFEIVLDGSCTLERINRFAKLGVGGFVLGTAVLFGEGKPSYTETINNLRKFVQDNKNEGQV